jgi:GGDEF domain-containing protein
MKGIKDSFLRLNIARKLLLGYLSLALLLIIISVFALSSLDRLNVLNASILERDVQLVDATEKMIDSVLAQELYANRYAILRSMDMISLLLKNKAEFDATINEIKGLPDTANISVDLISDMNDAYHSAIFRGIERLRDGETAFSAEDNAAIKKKQDELLGIIKEVAISARTAQFEKTEQTALVGLTAFKVTALLCGIGILLGIGASTLITRNISGSIHQLKLATEQISEGQFDDIPEVKNQDELGELSYAFKEMARRLKRLEEMYLDASPLTRLPGGVAIENVLKKRLNSDEPMAFCLVDMDNFKAYNDYYGYARGSELILETSRIVEESVKENGTEDDFIGHIGGDDFVIITIPHRVPTICQYIIDEFDRRAPAFYAEADRERGYIVSKSRQGQTMKFPIITLSIAVVTNQMHGLENHIQIGEIAAELKDHAKSMPGSLYVIDKRRHEKDEPDASNILKFPRADQS